ncbi:60S ribosomal protein L5 [Cichlidogyrus casuarinus]|uniref:Large ribosomal subunit protein uL18 n=1 Tax=Cichlidogyrus casuarinus TaxID=1844966 RepID=A0ABD2PXE9_9PLAT
MGLVKVIKNRAYFKRFQVKYRRRREGKTDYYARKRLIWQDKNKYNTPKYRLVVRITNTDIVSQIIFARIDGDKVLCSAYSHELKKYGIPVGLTNYPAAYCTGLLLARRVLKHFKLDTMYKGLEKADGSEFSVEREDNEKGPFTCYLDVGLACTTTGAKLFGVMKGAIDGGLSIPHSSSRFPGFDKESKQYDAAAHRDRIFGKNIAEYMEALHKDNPDGYKKQFSAYIKAGISAEKIAAMYTKAHAEIRKDPAHVKSTKKAPATHKTFKAKKLPIEMRKQRVDEKKQKLMAEVLAETA